jgi:hypothetical protein
MNESSLVERYNYDKFIPDKFEPWLNFKTSPPLGQAAPDYLLWNLDGEETSLSEIWKNNLYTIVEFGSFT